MTETVISYDQVVSCNDKVYSWLLIVIIDIYKYTRNKNDTETSTYAWLKNNSFFFSPIYYRVNVQTFIYVQM